MNTEEWDEVIDTNLKGTYLCTKFVVKGYDKEKIWKNNKYSFSSRS